MSKSVHIIGVRNVNNGLTSRKVDEWLNVDFVRSFSFFRLAESNYDYRSPSVPAVEITLSDGSKVVSDDVKYFRSLIAETKSDSATEKG